ncbi:hypothetical protein [Fuerstiella marisgermanici]|uniref:Uncharacterized protein n=1 Tax=Fuerstiella marisgermanici TaxID=1891926 RepID=A0A1P8WEZ4_9PLAN|nr:hypothetical protein [Fuerstiella marisgermanici]APZ92642.1 hypothetical protein Fuma_02253 [Fuerstiella marisgermanici]
MDRRFEVRAQEMLPECGVAPEIIEKQNNGSRHLLRPLQLASDHRMLWPDGISYNHDGYMYISATQVHLGALLNGGTDKTSKPFYIFRFKPKAPGIIGR